MATNLEYDVELDRVREDKTSEEMRDTIKAIRQALEKVDQLLKDVNDRLKNGGL